VKKTKSKKLVLNRETLALLEEPNLQLAAGGVTLRTCETSPQATCTTCAIQYCE